MVFEHNTRYSSEGQEDKLILTIPYEVLPDTAQEHFTEFEITSADILVDWKNQQFIITYVVEH